MDINDARVLVTRAGRKLVEAGLIARTWGNISCRVDESSFIITPSGRDYLSLTPEEMVLINITDLSYSGSIKPSSEKGLHAEAYKLRPEVSFIIHTHQEYASVIGSTELNSIKTPGNEADIMCAKYALPGTKALCKNVADAIIKSRVNSVIMKHHGALCFGRNYDEAFMAAAELESNCQKLIIEHYMKSSKADNYDSYEMSKYALSKHKKLISDTIEKSYTDYYESKRTENGFILYQDGEEVQVEYDNITPALPKEAAIYNSIYNKDKNINFITQITSPEILAISKTGIKLKPLLDDFAQLVGNGAKNVKPNPKKIAHILKKSPIVLIKGSGALCCGKTKADAEAAGIVAQKAAKALIGALLFGRVKYINALECMLMRFVYLKKYSKKIESNK